jgi:hypothetical protein
MLIKPALKSAITILEAPSARLRIGTRWRSFPLPEQWGGVRTKHLLELFTGDFSTVEIASKSEVDLNSVLSLVRELQQLNLVDLYRTPISHLRRYNSELGRIEEVSDSDDIRDDYAIEAFLHRMELECAATTFHVGDLDGGRSAVLGRRNFSILVFGQGKIVNSLLGVLSASGFSKVAVINRVGTRNPSIKITEGDVAGGFVGRSDIGEPRRKILHDIRTASQLFNEPKPEIQKPDLIISIGHPSPDSLQRWMADNTLHLLVDIATSADVRIGPLVYPGKSPCYRCIQLTKQSALLPTQSPEVGSALALSVASAIALDVIALADRARSIYLATSYIHSSHRYHQPEIQYWTQHHACGCAWS